MHEVTPLIMLRRARTMLLRPLKTLLTWTTRLSIAKTLCRRSLNTGKCYQSFIRRAATMLSTGRHDLRRGLQTVCTAQQCLCTGQHDRHSPRQDLNTGRQDPKRAPHDRSSGPESIWRGPPKERDGARLHPPCASMIQPSRPGGCPSDRPLHRSAQAVPLPRQQGRPRHHRVPALQAQ